MGTAALGCPAEQSSAGFRVCRLICRPDCNLGLGNPQLEIHNRKPLRGYLYIASATFLWGVAATLGRAAFTGRLLPKGETLRPIDPLILSHSRTTFSFIVLVFALVLVRGWGRRLLASVLSRSVPCRARVSSLCCGLRLTIWVAPGNRLTKGQTSRPICFTTGFPGSPNGPSLQSFPINSESVHRSGDMDTYGNGSRPCMVYLIEISVTDKREKLNPPKPKRACSP